MKFNLIIIICFLFCINLKAQPPFSSGSWQWARTIGAGGNRANGGDETVNQSAIDSKGNVYVCGKVLGYAAQNGYNNSNAYIGQNNNQQNSQEFKGFVAKYSCQGELLWYKTLGDSLGTSAFFDMLIDEDDNLYVTGMSPFGYARTYWGDSLISNLSGLGQLTGMTFGLMMKINTSNGSINWIFSSALDMAANVNWKFAYYQGYFGSGELNKYHHITTKGDTLVYIGSIDSIPNLSPDTAELDLFYFSKLNGTFIGKKRIMKIDYNKSNFIINGFYRYRGNYLALLNVQDTNLTFMGKPLHTPEASSGGFQYGLFYDAVPILLTFNDDSLIDQQAFEDSLFTRELMVNKFTNQIDFTVESHSFETLLEKGKPFKLKTTQPAQSYFNFPRGIVHLTNINQTKYLFTVDTANIQSWISISSIAPNGDLNIGLSTYGDISLSGYLKFKNIELKTQVGAITYKVAYINLGMSDTTINFYTTDIKNLDTLTDIEILNSQANEKGEFYLTGEINYCRILANNDTTFYQGGYTDLLTAKFGTPCDSTTSLISPILPTEVRVACNNGSIVINWKDNSHVEYGYIVYRSSSANGTYQTLDTLSANSVQYIDTSALANTSYWYKVASYNNIDTSYNNQIDSVTTCNVGFENLVSELKLIVYPNPSSNYIYFEVNSAINKIQIVDLTGRVLYESGEKKHYKNAIDISRFCNGIYFIKAFGNNSSTAVRKFIKID
ncbi:MAG: hypothetical protein RL065_1306 [Bacteroidota bacterium]|jgi:hypothetical protein